jgi:hypothetical protein
LQSPYFRERLAMHRSPVRYSVSFLFLLLGVSFSGAFGQVDAQSSGSQGAQGNQAAPSSDGTDVGGSQGYSSFVDEVFQDSRHIYGFSIGAFEIYNSDLYTSSSEKTPAAISAFNGRVFANYGRRGRSTLHLDYSISYEIYNRYRELDAPDHFGNLLYKNKLSRRFSLELYDQVSSLINDNTSTLTPVLAPPSSLPPLTNDFILERQRVARNQAGGRLDYQVARRSRLEVYGEYVINRYQTEDVLNFDGVQVGVGYEHRLTRWLYFSGSYSTYMNNADNQFRNTIIQRIQVGGFHYRLRRRWDLYANGGVEIADTRTVGTYVTGYGSCGMIWQPRFGIFELSYNHTLTSPVGVNWSSGASRVLGSDIVTGSWGRRLLPQLDLQVAASYSRSGDLEYAGLLEGFGARAGLNYLVVPHIVATAGYSYQNQRNTIAEAVNLLNVNRYMVYVGLQYVWPTNR